MAGTARTARASSVTASSERTLVVPAAGSDQTTPLRTVGLTRYTVVVNQTGGPGTGTFDVQKRDTLTWRTIATVPIGAIGTPMYRTFVISARQMRVQCNGQGGAPSTFVVTQSAGI